MRMFLLGVVKKPDQLFLPVPLHTKHGYNSFLSAMHIFMPSKNNESLNGRKHDLAVSRKRLCILSIYSIIIIFSAQHKCKIEKLFCM